MCSDTATPINFHLNSAVDPNTITWDGFGFEQTLAVVATMFSIGNAATRRRWATGWFLGGSITIRTSR
jgi:uncharacterized protein